MKRQPAKTEPSLDPAHLYAVLSGHYGPSGWWPGETPLEVMVGAVLTQNTAWTNVEKAIANLKTASLLDMDALHKTPLDTLAGHLRPSGYYNIKARRLRNLVDMIAASFDGSLDRLFALDADDLRATLLAVNGVGKETADSICCYAAGKLVFVVDAYTRRILSRHGIISGDAGYDDIQDLFENALSPDLDVYRDLHAHLVFIGKDYCRSRTPRCGECPLRGRV
ncbi:MAG TPA: endonuclease III domain-containing protein [Deltaproteobacteria bacterium]|jgi:endonuclease-3 related protein|nr:endonuclease III domain-containing protein [Deltaproteobacteria bacterium]HRW81654.1 endonuclease III domain-containing protein [Desulfomonilia bacterium]NMD40421.1 endonuclease III domain-containing protein [Deltaproteobacteria bacterium]HOC75649.1 endonuclease III domain-containing protein [Deltaproteobacteria bacterium]HON95362.1 endonuclease III domain-containing protein [Deltaproteobacteria bacterium]